VLTHRSFQLALREPTQYTARMVVIVGAMIFFSLTYLSSRERKQDQVQVGKRPPGCHRSDPLCHVPPRG
jgi:hypothetical protein